MNNEGSFNDEELRKRAASNEELNIRLTNNYAFQKIFKNEEIVKGFLMALLHLKETDIETLEVADPFVEGSFNLSKRTTILLFSIDSTVPLLLRWYTPEEYIVSFLFFSPNNTKSTPKMHKTYIIFFFIKFLLTPLTCCAFLLFSGNSSGIL